MNPYPAWYYNDIQQVGTDFEDMTIDVGFMIETASYLTPEYAEYICRRG
jgi:hypothetical protein